LKKNETKNSPPPLVFQFLTVVVGHEIPNYSCEQSPPEGTKYL
jgi:hypothetical protein